MSQDHLGIRIDGGTVPQVSPKTVKGFQLEHNPHLKSGDQGKALRDKLIGQETQDKLDKRWNASRYEDAVKFHLDELNKHQVGQAVLAALGDGHVRIEPEEFAVGVVQATAGPARVVDAEGCLKENRRVLVRFTPGHYVEGSSLYRRVALIADSANNTALPVDVSRSVGCRPEEVLLHELIHALLAVHCLHRLAERELPAHEFGGVSLTFHNEGELAAILLTNIYISEKNDPRVRLRLPLVGDTWIPAPMASRTTERSHLTFDPDIHPLTRQPGHFLVRDHNARNDTVGLLRPLSFHQNNAHWRVLKALVDNIPEMCVHIGRAPARFNPIREYLARVPSSN